MARTGFELRTFCIRIKLVFVMNLKAEHFALTPHSHKFLSLDVDGVHKAPGIIIGGLVLMN